MPASAPSRRLLNFGLWSAQVFVAVSFGVAAAMKLALPIPQLAAIWPWAGELPALAVRLLGLVDLAGAAGLLLPALTRIKPGLTPLAAACCVALQICALLFHASRGELAALPVNLVLIVLCVFVCWGRWERITAVGIVP